MKDELKVIVGVMTQGGDLTDLRIRVNNVYLSGGNNTVVSNRDLAAFLHRLDPDDLQFDGNVGASVCRKIESDLAALRESRPEKINGQMLEALIECRNILAQRSLPDETDVHYMRAHINPAIRNAKEAQ